MGFVYERLDELSTADFLVINALYHNYPLNTNLRIRLRKITEAGIVEHIGRSKYVLARSLYSVAGRSGVHTRIVGLDRDTNKELLVNHIHKNGSNGTLFKELQQVLPGQSRGQIQTLLRELRATGRITCVDSTSAAKWYPAETSEN